MQNWLRPSTYAGISDVHIVVQSRCLIPRTQLRCNVCGCSGGEKIVLIYIIYIHFSSLQSRLHGLTSDEVEPGSSEQDFYMNYLLLSLLLQSPWQARRDIFFYFFFFKQVNISGQSKQPEFHLVKVRGGGFEVVPLIDFFFAAFSHLLLLIVAN